MSKPNYKSMTHKDLRQYVVEHQDDQEAFYELVDRFHANPNKVRVGADEDVTPYIQGMVEQVESKQRDERA